VPTQWIKHAVLTDHPFSKFVRFLGVGVFCTAAHYAVLVLLVQWATLAAVQASAIGFAVGALVNYVLNYRFTFRSTKRHREAMLKFFIVAIIGLGLNTACMAVGVGPLRLHYLLSQILATGLVLIWNFTGNHLWTFRQMK